METQHLINYGLMTVMAVIGWFAREMWSAVKELRSDLAVLRSELPRDYVQKRLSARRPRVKRNYEQSF